MHRRRTRKRQPRLSAKSARRASRILSAARISHTENAWLFTRTTEPRRLVGGTACEVIGSREYEAYEIVKLVEWLADRKAGYPSLKQFEGGANWPERQPGDPAPPVQYRTRSG